MGGGGGIIIIRNNLRTALSNPIVHGQLPPDMADEVTEILSVEDHTWTESDLCNLNKAFSWAVHNCT